MSNSIYSWTTLYGEHLCYVASCPFFHLIITKSPYLLSVEATVYYYPLYWGKICSKAHRKCGQAYILLPVRPVVLKMMAEGLTSVQCSVLFELSLMELHFIKERMTVLRLDESCWFLTLCLYFSPLSDIYSGIRDQMHDPLHEPCRAIPLRPCVCFWIEDSFIFLDLSEALES